METKKVPLHIKIVAKQNDETYLMHSRSFFDICCLYEDKQQGHNKRGRSISFEL